MSPPVASPMLYPDGFQTSNSALTHELQTHISNSPRELVSNAMCYRWHHPNMSQIKLGTSPCLPEMHSSSSYVVVRDTTQKSEKPRIFHPPHLVTKMSQFYLRISFTRVPSPQPHPSPQWRLTAVVFPYLFQSVLFSYLFQSVLYTGLGGLFLSSLNPASAPYHLQYIIQML